MKTSINIPSYLKSSNLALAILETAEATAEATAEETAEETVKETVKETAEETVKETVKETAEETVKETAEETEEQINSLDDLENYLKTIHFWGLEEISYNVYKYTFDNRKNIYLNIQNFGCYFQYYKELNFVLNHLEICYESMNYCAKLGFLNSIKILRENNCNWDTKTFEILATNGHIHCIKFFRKGPYCPWNRNCVEFAVYAKHLECVKYMIENGCFYDHKKNSVGSTLCTYAVKNGDYECLIYLYEKNCIIDKNTMFAAVNPNSDVTDNINCIKFLYEKKCEFIKDICCLIAFNFNRINHLEYLNTLT